MEGAPQPVHTAPQRDGIGRDRGYGGHEEKLLRYAESARELGCEIFEVDAGWYGREPDWSSSVGDWREKLDGAFYGRLAEFADKIRGMGMGFGLWMEPERI
ncbi:MAG: hypothetical protein HFH91_20155, partial [Lachnospiraceae bacterium]|nr:hypothetical protein [Lachnospiraceae bacterium]